MQNLGSFMLHQSHFSLTEIFYAQHKIYYLMDVYKLSGLEHMGRFFLVKGILDSGLFGQSVDMLMSLRY